MSAYIGEGRSDDFNVFQETTKAAAKKLKLKLSAAQLKAILEAVSWRDPEAKPVLLSYKKSRDGYQTDFEPDSELRDTENVPMNYLGEDVGGTLNSEDAISAYFDAEVLPHVPDAWVAQDKTVIGYEISFNKYFYVHQPLRDLAEVVQEIRDLEKETEGLLEKILDFGS